MSDERYPDNTPACDRLIRLLRGPGRLCDTDSEPGISGSEAPPCGIPLDIVVTVGEINDEHGTGPLLKRVFKGRRNVFSIRSRDDWGVHDFGTWHAKLSKSHQTRPEAFRQVLRFLEGRNVRSVLCVPFTTDELLVSIAIHELFHARLCVWIMDDQNVAANGIPDGIMREFLERCSLRLATHPELRLAYQRKYRLPVYILPAVVPHDLVLTEDAGPPGRTDETAGALLGSFWDQSWFDRLCDVLEPCKQTIDWFGQNRSPWLKFPPEDLKRAGIRPFGVVPEQQLAARLREYPFVIVPVGTLDEKDKNTGVASLSLPGRILFAAASSHTPLLVVGSQETCGARFVNHFGIGQVVPYDSSRLKAATRELREPPLQMAMRRNAASIASALSDRGIVEWLSTSIAVGKPADMRFEDAFSGYNAVRDPSPECVAR